MANTECNTGAVVAEREGSVDVGGVVVAVGVYDAQADGGRVGVVDCLEAHCVDELEATGVDGRLGRLGFFGRIEICGSGDVVERLERQKGAWLLWVIGGWPGVVDCLGTTARARDGRARLGRRSRHFEAV